MKKIFALAILVLLSAAAIAQTLPTSGTVKTVTTTETNQGFYLSVTANGRIVAAYNYVYRIDIAAPVYYSYGVKLIDVTGSNTATVVLAGSLDNVYYKTITTVNYTGAGADTTIIGNITSSPLSYKYYKVTVTPTDTMWVKSMFLNFVPTK